MLITAVWFREAVSGPAARRRLPSPAVPRVFSGIQPSGELHLGTYLGALRRFVADQARADVAASASSTSTPSPCPRTPCVLRRRTLETAALYLASGLDPDVCTLFVQSHVPEHAELAWLMECTVSLRRAAPHDAVQGEVRAAASSCRPACSPTRRSWRPTSCSTTPTGCRWATTSASTSSSPGTSPSASTTATATPSRCPEADIPKVGARVMDLQDPTRKMSKSIDSPQGTVLMLDDPAVIERKFKRAVTDTDGEVRYDPEAKPGVSNLLVDPRRGHRRRPGGAGGRLHAVRPAQGRRRGRRHRGCCARSRPATPSWWPTRPRLAELLAKGADKARADRQVTLGGAARGRPALVPVHTVDLRSRRQSASQTRPTDSTANARLRTPQRCDRHVVTGRTCGRAQRSASEVRSVVVGGLEGGGEVGGTVHSSSGWWCSRAQATVRGSLPASSRRSPPSSGCRR